MLPTRRGGRTALPARGRARSPPPGAVGRGTSGGAGTMTGPVQADLTPEQQAAVTHPGGPAIVLAGAGAGKTRVLCHRLAWLVEGGAAPAEVLALTFTREA